MEIKTCSPSTLKAARLCEARLLAKLEDDTYEEAKGELAAIGILAHQAAKIWYRHEESTVDAAFKRAITESSNGRFGNENPRTNEGIGEARTLFEAIIAHYRREGLKIVFAERRYKGTLSNGVPVHLIIDLAVDRGNGDLEIIDYKTGFITMTKDDMWNEDQVLMNLVAVRLDPEFAHYKSISFTYFWVRSEEESGPVCMGNERLSDYAHYLTTEYQRLLDITPETAKEMINPYCGSCGRRLKCTEYRKLMTEAFDAVATTEDAVMSEVELGKITPQDLMKQYSKISTQLKLMEKSKSAIGEALGALHSKTDQRVIEDGDFKSSVIQSSSLTYNSMTALALAQNRGINPCSIFSVSSKRVEDAFGSDQEAMAMLKQTATKQPRSSYVKIGASAAKTDANDKVKKEQKKADKAAAKAAAAAVPVTADLPSAPYVTTVN